MPDAHQGYGFPIGGVAAFDLDEGIISPGGVGYDINCGVRLLATGFREQDIAARRRELLAEIFKEVPAGVGKGGVTKLSRGVLCEILAEGAEWAVRNGYGLPEDLERTEEGGRMRDADPGAVSDRAHRAGHPPARDPGRREPFSGDPEGRRGLRRRDGAGLRDIRAEARSPS